MVERGRVLDGEAGERRGCYSIGGDREYGIEWKRLNQSQIMEHCDFASANDVLIVKQVLEQISPALAEPILSNIPSPSRPHQKKAVKRTSKRPRRVSAAANNVFSAGDNSKARSRSKTSQRLEETLEGAQTLAPPCKRGITSSKPATPPKKKESMHYA
ncbi:hypothetical protein ACLOJK_026258 [Asimina triloba]